MQYAISESGHLFDRALSAALLALCVSRGIRLCAFMEDLERYLRCGGDILIADLVTEATLWESMMFKDQTS
jgi:hypothetical protein